MVAVLVLEDLQKLPANKLLKTSEEKTFQGSSCYHTVLLHADASGHKVQSGEIFF